MHRGGPVIGIWFLGPLILGAVAQVALAPRLPVVDGSIDLVLVLVVVWTAIRGLPEGIGWGVIGGALVDLYSITPFGISILLYAVAAALVGFGRWHTLRGNFVLAAIGALVATGIVDAFLLGTLQLLGRPIDWSDMMRSIAFSSAVANAFAAAVLYFPLSRLNRRLGGEPALNW